ncbi:hypothetical protein [Megasphaera sp.]|uniref:hypothetical protein n=1 Tax=Megasphaera sp. TaxID=2023260 RepID=UPI0027BA91B0|nr:hypothetical protein [Megasphaera sp.]
MKKAVTGHLVVMSVTAFCLVVLFYLWEYFGMRAYLSSKNFDLVFKDIDRHGKDMATFVEKCNPIFEGK